MESSLRQVSNWRAERRDAGDPTGVTLTRAMQEGDVLRKAGLGLFVIGMMVVVYGAVAFWLVNSLPPNGGPAGRLPSLYVMAAGIVGVLVGLALRGLKIGVSEQEARKESTGGIPAFWGILILVLILVAALVVIAQM